MISQTYRLIAPKQIRTDFIEEELDKDQVIVKPLYLSICAADQRYYTGNRDPKALEKKLPMALIHESVGEVIYDPSGTLKKHTKVVMIPNTPTENDEVIRENYLRTSHFKSSGYDGFMRSFVIIQKDRIIPYSGIEDSHAALLELISVAYNALDAFNKHSHKRKKAIGVWGDGSVGFITALILKISLPESKIILFGHNEEKMQYFQFCNEIYNVNNIPENITVDHGFECVGGAHSEDAINQIIDIINPQGTVCLMGVSEKNVPINTRMILEKGLSFIGNSRSGYQDFKNGIELLEKNPNASKYLNRVISDIVTVKSIADIHHAFELDSTNNFKTIMKWEM